MTRFGVLKEAKKAPRPCARIVFRLNQNTFRRFRRHFVGRAVPNGRPAVDILWDSSDLAEFMKRSTVVIIIFPAPCTFSPDRIGSIPSRIR